MRWLMNRDRVIQRRMSQSDTILFSSFPFFFFLVWSLPTTLQQRWMDGCAGVPFLLLFPHFPIFYFGFSLFPPSVPVGWMRGIEFYIIHRVRICLLLCCAVESFNFAFLLLFIFLFSGSVKRAGRGRNRISGGGSGGSTEEETELDGWMDGVGEGRE